MVAWSGGYYVAPFRGEIGVTQGDPLLPTILKNGGGCSGLSLGIPCGGMVGGR